MTQSSNGGEGGALTGPNFGLASEARFFAEYAWRSRYEPHLIPSSPKLCTTRKERDRAAAAMRLTDLVELLAAARDECAGVRECAALNPNMPREALFTLASDSVTDVRMAAARNPMMPPDVVVALAKDSRREVRLAAMMNPVLPDECVAQMASSDRSEMVREVAVDEGVRWRLPLRTGIDRDNEGALAMVASERWWKLTPESPSVRLALRVYPNA